MRREAPKGVVKSLLCVCEAMPSQPAVLFDATGHPMYRVERSETRGDKKNKAATKRRVLTDNSGRR